jgi:hypothetical protein
MVAQVGTLKPMVEEVNATQAAVLCGYSERTIRRKIASGQIPARRIATNRFAIRVSDLPDRQGENALSKRVTALELRVHELDQQLQLLGAQEPAEAHPEEQRQDSVATLRELLLQLMQETGRLGPLLTTPEAESEWK